MVSPSTPHPFEYVWDDGYDWTGLRLERISTWKAGHHSSLPCPRRRRQAHAPRPFSQKASSLRIWGVISVFFFSALIIHGAQGLRVQKGGGGSLKRAVHAVSHTTSLFSCSSPSPRTLPALNLRPRGRCLRHHHDHRVIFPQLPHLHQQSQGNSVSAVSSYVSQEASSLSPLSPSPRLSERFNNLFPHYRKAAVTGLSFYPQQQPRVILPPPASSSESSVDRISGEEGGPGIAIVEAKREVRFWKIRVRMYNRLIKSARRELHEARRLMADSEKNLEVLRGKDPFDDLSETKALKLMLSAREDEMKRVISELQDLESKKKEANALFQAQIRHLEVLRKSPSSSPPSTSNRSSENVVDTGLLGNRKSSSEKSNDQGDIDGFPFNAGTFPRRAIHSDDLKALVRETEGEVAGMEERLKSTTTVLEEAREGKREAEERLSQLLKQLRYLRKSDPLDSSVENINVMEEAGRAKEAVAYYKSEMARASIRLRGFKSSLKYSQRRLRREQSLLDRVLEEASRAIAEAESSAMAKTFSRGGGSDGPPGTGLIDKVKVPFALLSVLLSRAESRKLAEEYIGWLKRDPSLPPVEDKTNRFHTLLSRMQLLPQEHVRTTEEEGDDIAGMKKKEGEEDDPSGYSLLRNDVYYVFVPGFLWQIYPAYFDSTVNAFRKAGLQAKLCSQVGGASGVYENAAAIRREIIDAYSATQKKVVLVTHSKGGIDSAAALSLYQDELQDIVRGIVFCQCPFGGAPLATDLTGDPVHYTLAHWMRKYVRGSWQSVLDMMYQSRRDFLRKHPLPPNIATVSFHSSTNSPTSIQQILTRYVKKRYGKANDGLVIPDDAEIPGSSVVRYESELDHVGTVWPPDKRSLGKLPPRRQQQQQQQQQSTFDGSEHGISDPSAPLSLSSIRRSSNNNNNIDNTKSSANVNLAATITPPPLSTAGVSSPTAVSNNNNNNNNNKVIPPDVVLNGDKDTTAETTYRNPSMRPPTRYAQSVGWIMVAVDGMLRRISREQPTQRNDVPSAPELFGALVALLQEDSRY